jgi:hypothetical protein
MRAVLGWDFPVRPRNEIAQIKVLATVVGGHGSADFHETFPSTARSEGICLCARPCTSHKTEKSLSI